MASAKHIFGEFLDGTNKNVPGEEVYVLKLDSNEMEAIDWFIATSHRKTGEFKYDVERANSGVLHSTSLAASGVRVVEAIRAARKVA